jgi:glutamate transport system substrate-binding protein
VSDIAPVSRPGPGSATHGPGAWRSAITAASVTVLLVLGGVAGCTDRATPRQSVQTLRAKSPTLQKTLQRNGRLRIAVREDVPSMFYKDPVTGRRSGFDIEIAKAVAAELGYPEDRIEWVVIRTLPDRLSVLQADQADMVLADFSMTDEREKYVDFAGPYLLVPQAVLVRRDRPKPLRTIADLRAADVRVCTSTGSTSEQALKDQSIVPLPLDTNADCMAGMKRGDYDAFSTDLPILAGLRAADRDATAMFEILEMAVAKTDERIGIAVPNNDRWLRDLVAHILDTWQKGPPEQSSWLRAYDRTIGPLLEPRYRSQPPVDNPPAVADYESKAPRA